MDYWCALWFWPITQSALSQPRTVVDGNRCHPGRQHRRSSPSRTRLDFAPRQSPSTCCWRRRHTYSPERHRRRPLHRRNRACTTAMANSASAACARLPPHRHGGKVRRPPPLLSLGTRLRRHLCLTRRLRSGVGKSAVAQIEWNEAGILGEVNPLFAIRKLNATEISQTPQRRLRPVQALQAIMDGELEEAEATQNYLNASRIIRH